MRIFITASALTVTMLSLSACGSTGLLNRDRPDEFAVSRQAPLVIPPDFALVPPAVGSSQPASADSTRQAFEAMFGGPAPRSVVERAVVGQAGRDNAMPGIRSSVGDAQTNVVDKGDTTNAIIAAPQGDGQYGQAVIPQ